MLLVFNRHYGSHEELPFDLRNKGGAIVFDLPPDADRKLMDAEQRVLIGTLVRALQPYMQEQADQANSGFEETPASFTQATYFDKGEILAQIG